MRFSRREIGRPSDWTRPEQSWFREFLLDTLGDFLKRLLRNLSSEEVLSSIRMIFPYESPAQREVDNWWRV